MKHLLILFFIAIFVIIAMFWGLKLLALKNSVPRLAEYWSKPIGPSGGLVYVALGDSAAQGIGASAPSLSYPSLIAKHVSDTSNRPVQIINLSKTGARLIDVIQDQLPELAKLKPDLVTIEIGANDIRHYSAESYAQQMAIICSKLPAGTVISDSPFFNNPKFEVFSLEASTVIRKEAATNSLIVAPLHAHMLAEGQRALLTNYAADWFHPNNRGYRVWAEAFVEALPSTNSK